MSDNTKSFFMGFLLGLLLARLLCHEVQAIEPDKVMHANAGLLIGLTATTLTKKSRIGCITSIAIGAAKELNDDVHDAEDFAYTAGWGCLASWGLGRFIVYSDKHRQYIGVRL